MHMLEYALCENGNRPQAVVMVPGVLELDMKGRAGGGACARGVRRNVRNAGQYGRYCVPSAVYRSVP
jgi:hypothetical protein